MVLRVVTDFPEEPFNYMPGDVLESDSGKKFRVQADYVEGTKRKLLVTHSGNFFLAKFYLMQECCSDRVLFMGKDIHEERAGFYQREYGALNAMRAEPSIISLEDSIDNHAIITELSNFPTTPDIFDQQTLTDLQLIQLLGYWAGQLHRVQQSGRIHGDFKPNNVIADPQILSDGPLLNIYRGCMLLLDFELAYSHYDLPQDYPLPPGTAHYMAPEVVKGEFHENSDMYCWYSAAFQMITGKFPWEEGLPNPLAQGMIALETFRMATEGRPPLGWKFKGFEEIIENAGHPDPEKRTTPLRAVEAASEITNTDLLKIVTG